MVKLRDPNKDERKSIAVLKEQHRKNKTCMLVDCNNPISVFEGPGSDSLCREHQLLCVEYGGMGKPERPHTFYRDWGCEICGYDPRLDDRFNDITDPYEKLRAMRAVMHGDHIHLKSHGGSDAKDNIRSVCQMCHTIKTIKEKDYLGQKKLSTD